MVKRTGLIIIILMTLVLILYLSFEIVEDEVLPIGSSIPAISFVNNMGQTKQIDKDGVIIVILYFHLECEHCRYQLGLINNELDRFNDTKMFFLTNDSDLFQDNKFWYWDKLMSSEDVTFGIINKNEFGLAFGKLVLPSLFIFNIRGKLNKKIYGEVKLEKLLKEISLAGNGKK